MKKAIPETKHTAYDLELEQALRTIHEKYGNDFQAFLRDVQETIRKRNAKTKTTACIL